MSASEHTPNNQMVFKEEVNNRNRIMVLHDNLKRHLSAEYMYISERKDSLESEVIELKFELNQKDKKLFKNSNQSDTRQLFSPLNLTSINETQKDERMRQIISDVAHLESEISMCDNKLNEIKELLIEIDSIQATISQEDIG